MIRLAGLGHLGLRVRDLEAMVRFYADVMGLALTAKDERHAWLGLEAGEHCLYLAQEEGPAVHHLAFALRPGQKLAAADELRAAQISVTEGSSEPGGHGETIRFLDPDGQVLELFQPSQKPAGPVAGRPLRPNRLQHLVLQTPEVERAAAFYHEKLGLRISDWMGRKFVWLRCGTDHHDLAIVYAKDTGMDHFAYEIADWDEIKRWCDFLAPRDIKLMWGPGRHGPGNNLFIMFPDPDGNRVELSCEMEQFYEGAATYRPREWTDIPTALNLWGPGPTWRA